jgi:hypothetical protein
MLVRAMALLLLLSPSVGQPELSDACRDPARRNPCEGHREVACFLAGISLREVRSPEAPKMTTVQGSAGRRAWSDRDTSNSSRF